VIHVVDDQTNADAFCRAILLALPVEGNKKYYS
jgi:hypothetical protein